MSSIMRMSSSTTTTLRQKDKKTLTDHQQKREGGTTTSSSESLMSSVSSPDSRSILYSGVLVKRGHVIKNWLSRWFVLTQHNLIYYKRSSSSSSGSSTSSQDAAWIAVAKYQRGIIPLSNVIKIEKCATKIKSRSNCFHICAFRHSNTKSTVGYYMQCPSAANVNAWVKQIQKAVDECSRVNLLRQKKLCVVAAPAKTLTTTTIQASSLPTIGEEALHILLDTPEHEWALHFDTSIPNHSNSWNSNLCRTLTPGEQVAKMLIQDFPALTRMLVDMDQAKTEKELVFVMDQIVLEVKDGSCGEIIRNTIMAAAERKLRASTEIWTLSVKTVYGTIMRAARSMHSCQRIIQVDRDMDSSTSASATLAKKPTMGSEEDKVGLTLDQEKRRLFHQVYEQGRVLGAGGSSIVRIARHRATQKQFAVKIISKEHLTREQIEDLESEVEIMRALDHDNLVPLIEFFDQDDTCYIVTPLCTGGELFDELVKREYYTEEDARELMIKLASALAYLHDKGIVHRDLKPENILLKSSLPHAQVMIADFGFAKALKHPKLKSSFEKEEEEETEEDSDDTLNTACGTPGYIAPEVVLGQRYSVQVDCWSLGVILYILLCGYPPFGGSNHAEILRKIVAGEYSFHSPYWDTVSPEARDLVEKLLNVDPASRWSAAQVLEHPFITCVDDDDDDPEEEGNDTFAPPMRQPSMRRRHSDLSSALNEMRKFNLSKPPTTGTCAQGPPPAPDATGPPTPIPRDISNNPTTI